MSLTLAEKLRLENDKTVLIQGLPSSIEKSFAKVAFAKNMTPLLKSRKLDFVLVFAVNLSQLNGILNDIMPGLKCDTKFWVAFPKVTSKIVTDLNRDSSWQKLTTAGYECSERIELDHVWVAAHYRQCVDIELTSLSPEAIPLPEVAPRSKSAKVKVLS